MHRHMLNSSLPWVVQVADLRVALQRAEQQQARKEDYLREEISQLQQVRDAPFSNVLFQDTTL